MRQLSKRTQYSLRALYALADNYGGGPMLITKLAKDEAIPKKFLEQILLALKGIGRSAVAHEIQLRGARRSTVRFLTESPGRRHAGRV